MRFINCILFLTLYLNHLRVFQAKYNSSQGTICSSVDKQDNEVKDREEDANQFQFQSPIIFSNYREIQVPPFLDENDP